MAERVEEAAEQDASTFLKETKKLMDIGFKSEIVLPGDDVTEIVTRVTKKIKLGKHATGYSPRFEEYSCVSGGGLVQMGDAVKCVNAGALRYRPPNRYWVDYKYKRVRH